MATDHGSFNIAVWESALIKNGKPWSVPDSVLSPILFRFCSQLRGLFNLIHFINSQLKSLSSRQTKPMFSFNHIHSTLKESSFVHNA